MASVHQKFKKGSGALKSPFWHASYMGPDGRWILRSTKLEDRQAALAMAIELERVAKLARRGELVEAQARRAVADIMARADMGETLRSVSIKSYFDSWLAGKVARNSKATGKRYKATVDKFLESLGNRDGKPITALTAADVQRFIDQRAGRGLAPMTVNMDGKVIRTALNTARRQGLISTNPAHAVELPKDIGMERGTFTPAEIKMLVDAADGEWKTMILFGAYSGARLVDCSQMKWEFVDLAEQILTYWQGKTGKIVPVPLHPELLAHLNQLAGTDKPAVFIMPELARQSAEGPNGLTNTFKNIVLKAGLDLQTVKGAGIQMFSRRTFHAFRHTFTSTLANKNVSSELRMKLTGHKTVGEHQKYTHYEIENLRAAINKIPSLGAK